MGENIAMTRHQPEGQSTRRYRYRATASVSRSLVRRGDTGQQSTRQVVPVKSGRSIRQDQGEQQVVLRRKVTMPHEAIRPLTWAERKQLHQPQEAQPIRQYQLVS